MKRRKLIGWPIVLIISCFIIVISVWFGFTQGGLSKIGYDLAGKGTPYYITTPFIGSDSTAYSGIIATGIYFLTDGFLSLFVFDSSMSIVTIACYVILVLSFIVIVIQIASYIRNKKPSMILWVILTLIFAYGACVICGMANGYFGANGEYWTAPTEIGEANPISIRNVLFFDQTLRTNVGNSWTALGMTAFAWLAIIGILLFVLSFLVILIQTLVYAHSHRMDKYLASHPELAEANKTSVGFKNGEVGIGGTMNNINTVGNSSPLVVQYINSYGQDGMPSMSQPRSEVQTQASAPQQQTQPVGQVPYQYPPYGYPYPPMFGYYGPAQDNCKNAPLTKEDLKEVVNSAIASIKEEMASKQKEEAPIVEEKVYKNENGEELEYVDFDDLKTLIKNEIKTAVDELTPIQVEPQKEETKEDPTIIPDETVGYSEKPQEEEKIEKVVETPTSFKSEKEIETKIEMTTPIVVAVPSKAIEEDLPEKEETSEPTEPAMTEDEVRSLISDELKEALKGFVKPKKKRIIHRYIDNEVPEKETETIVEKVSSDGKVIEESDTKTQTESLKEEATSETTPIEVKTPTSEVKEETHDEEQKVSEEKSEAKETKPVVSEVVTPTEVKEEALEEVKASKAEETKASTPTEVNEEIAENKVEAPKEVSEPIPEETPTLETKTPVRNEPRGKEAEIEKGEVIRLNFFERIATGDEILKKNYQSLKSLLLSYGLKDRVSNTGDTFRLHKVTYAKITALGDSLKIYLALDPKEYYSTALPVQDVSKKDAYKDIPLAFKVRSDLSLRRANELITATMRKANFEPIEGFTPDDYVQEIKEELEKEKTK